MDNTKRQTMASFKIAFYQEVLKCTVLSLLSETFSELMWIWSNVCEIELYLESLRGIMLLVTIFVALQSLHFSNLHNEDGRSRVIMTNGRSGNSWKRETQAEK